MNIVDFLNAGTTGNEVNPERGYLGMSTIGNPCIRALQYDMHLASGDGAVSKRIARLFKDGHAFEDKLIEIFSQLGIHIYGRQDSLHDETGMWSGHTDGELMYDGVRYLLEMKTHNDKNFQAVKKQGVKKAKPVHYDQMQIYMGYNGITVGLYAAYNKNDSDLYFEEVEFNQDHFDKLKRKAVDVIATDVLLPRIGNNSPAWYECKFCNHKGVCHGMELPDKNCRTCSHVEAHNDNKWTCNNEMTPEYNLDLKMQKRGCGEHLYSGMFNEA